MKWDTCHVWICEEPAADIQWCPSLGVCIQVCTAHAFDTLDENAVIDVERASEDHKRNLTLYLGEI